MAILELTTTIAPTSSPKSTLSAPAVDIVAVHDVLEEGLEAWTEPDSGILWLRDLFPHQRFNARILIYQYDGEILSLPGGQGSVDRTLPLANSLVAELCADRQLANALKRPVVFICHGFGGLLVKRALAFSSTRKARAVEHLRSLFTSTYAIIFLGTPHNGLRKDSLLLQSDSAGPSQFMLNLLRNSELLQEITDQFAPLMKKFAIYNLWEQKKTQLGSLSAYIVEEDSAAPIWDDAERCGISATHADMIKFKDVHDHGYRILLGALVRYVESAHPLIQYRWEKDIEALESERQLEAETLMKPPMQYLFSDDNIKTNCNEWFIIPHCSITYFTGRRHQADVVREKLGLVNHLEGANRHKICVIYGLGGAGKTQFCLRYAEDNKARYWGVFWVDASSEENAENSYAELGRLSGKGATFSGGMHWLSQCTKPWLLIIDNADDPDMDVSKYFPVGGSGHILVTTRNPGVEVHATAGHLRFSGLDPQDAVNLLFRTAFPKDESPSPRSDSQQTAHQITSELGYLALAIANAGTSIRRHIYTLEMYLRHYLGHRKEMITRKTISTADQANIITTWEIPFQRIISRRTRECKDAVDLIHLSAFMHHMSIPEAIFQRAWTNIDTRRKSQGSLTRVQTRSDWDEGSQIRLRTALSILYNHSIIEHDLKRGVVSIHPVVKRWAKDRMPEEDQELWLNAAMAVLAKCISPLMEASGQRLRRSLLPHIEACLRELTGLYGTVSLSTVERVEAIERFAWVFAENGLWKRARLYQQGVLDFRTKKFGRFHQCTIQAQRSLNESNFNLFDLRPCIMAQRKLLVTQGLSRPSLADWMVWPPWLPKHVPYCLTLSDMTLSLWFAGQLEWSKYTGERAVDRLKRRLGPDDPLTLTAMFNLARTYHHLREQEASRTLLLTVLRKRKRFFGLNHPDTLSTRNELGMSLCAAGQHLSAAERLVSNVLEARKKILGEEHAYTLWSMNDLARVYTARQRPNDAIAILDKAHPLVERTLGETHPGMSMTRANLAQAYVRSKRWSDAEKLLLGLMQAVPKDHPDSVVAMSGYIYVRIAMGHLESAEADCLKALDAITTNKALSKDARRPLAIADLLSTIYRKQERWQELDVLKAKYPALSQSDREKFNIWQT